MSSIDSSRPSVRVVTFSGVRMIIQIVSIVLNDVWYYLDKLLDDSSQNVQKLVGHVLSRYVIS